MPFAYDWLTKQQKSKIEQIFVDTFDNGIKFKLLYKPGSVFHEIIYRRNGRSTLITLGKNDLLVPQHFSDVFLEDLETVLMNQKTVLEYFRILSEGNVISTAKYCLCLDEILKSRNSALAIKKVHFSRITVSQGMSMVRYLNSEELDNLIFVLPPEPVSFEDFLNEFRNLENGYEFNLYITVKTIGKDDVKAINELSSFSEIINYINIDSEFLLHPAECREILSEKFDLAKGIKWSITRRRKNPYLFQKQFKEKAMIINDVFERTARSVLEIPLPMKSILKQLDCFDIQRLRKVNRRVRECIDTVKPDPHIENYSISFDILRCHSEINVHFHLECGDFKKNRYWNNEHNQTRKIAFHQETLPQFRPINDVQRCAFCQRSSLLPSRMYQKYQTVEGFDMDFLRYTYRRDYLRAAKSQLFPSIDYINIFLTDFEATLRHQKSCMEELSIVYECLKNNPYTFEKIAKVPYIESSKEIGAVLKRIDHPLKTRKFSMGSKSQSEMMEIIPTIDKKFLKIIELLCPSNQKNLGSVEIKELEFEVDQLSQTDQWKNAEQLVSKYLTITTPIQDMNILHFVHLEILVKTLSSKDVFYLTTNLLKYITLQKSKIFFWQSAIDESLHRLIGAPYRNFSDVKKIWYFRIPNTDYYIHIVLDTRDVKDEEGQLKPKFIIFTRVAKEDTPFFELPINQLAIN